MTFNRIKRIWWNLSLDIAGIVHGKNYNHIPPTYLRAETGLIAFGDNLSLNHNVTIDANNDGFISIGDNVIIGMNTVLRASNHDIKDHTKHTGGTIFIGSNVWIGANCVILPNVSIGAGTTIGAGSIVTKSIPSGVVAAGNPCKIINTL